MSQHYNEYYNGQTGLTVGIKRLLYSRQSDYQLIEVFETDTWGNMLTIDGMVMLSEKDEFVYHEMLSHVGLATHPSPQRVLIIGGGDGGTAREVMKHPSVEHVDLVEIDRFVVEASREYLTEVGDFDNPKLHLHFEDGIDFVKRSRSSYDLIIIDGSDPVGPAEGLIEESFFEACYAILNRDGVLTVQTESPWVDCYHPAIVQVESSLKSLFRHTEMYLCYIPLYPAGMWSMMCGSRGAWPLDEEVLQRAAELEELLPGLKYYNREIHRAAFALPGFVRRILE